MSDERQRGLLVARIDWAILEKPRLLLDDVKTLLGEEAYAQDKRALKEFLCGYFISGENCTREQGRSISPVGANRDGAKRLKVRWKYPGCGKSGGIL